MDSTLERVSKILTTWCNLRGHAVEPDLRFDALDLDSLTVVEITLALDKEFNSSFHEKQIMDANTVAELVTVIDEHTAAG